MKSRSGSPQGIYTMGIAALFLAGFLLLVTFGARTYRDAAENQANNNDARALLSYLSTCVKGGDAAGNVAVLEEGQGPVLEVRNGAGYALYIYQNDGKLLEEYKAVGGTLNPQSAGVLGETEVFAVERVTGKILRITTDAGSVLLTLRSGEGLS